jgi:hypothetical protein
MAKEPGETVGIRKLNVEANAPPKNIAIDLGGIHIIPGSFVANAAISCIREIVIKNKRLVIR